MKVTRVGRCALYLQGVSLLSQAVQSCCMGGYDALGPHPFFGSVMTDEGSAVMRTPIHPAEEPLDF